MHAWLPILLVQSRLHADQACHVMLLTPANAPTQVTAQPGPWDVKLVLVLVARTCDHIQTVQFLTIRVINQIHGPLSICTVL